MGVVCLVSTLHRAYDMAGPKSTMVVEHPRNCKTEITPRRRKSTGAGVSVKKHAQFRKGIPSETTAAQTP